MMDRGEIHHPRTDVFNTGASAPYVWPRARTLFSCYVDTIGAG
jgi:hypothetical protein